MQSNQAQLNKNTGNENLTLKAYEKKVKEDVRLINENLHELLKLFKIEDDRTMKVHFCCFSFSLKSLAKIQRFYFRIMMISA